MGRTRLPSKEPFPPHTVSNTTSSDSAGRRAPGRGLECLQIADPVRMNEGQPYVPDILQSLREKVNRLTPMVQNLQVLANALEKRPCKRATTAH